MKKLDVEKTAKLLKQQNKILILTHRNPDGDTLGSAFSLMHALKRLGITAKVFCCDEIPEKYNYMFEKQDFGEYDDGDDFTVVAVDIADAKLIGSEYIEKYSDRVKLCIDHHISNKEYAENLLLRDCAAACEIIYDVINALGVEIDKVIADCLYTGISTDTGCFLFSNVTQRTHLIAADLIEKGADFTEINKVMFETKSKGYFLLEAAALQTIETYFDGKCAIMTITQEMMDSTGTSESDCDGIAGIPRKIEGVLVSATLRERNDGTFKASLRSHAPVDSSKICLSMGGGGHARAAGCELSKECFDNDKAKLLTFIKEELDRI